MYLITFHHLHILNHVFFYFKKYGFMLMLNELFTGNNLADERGMFFLAYESANRL